jgi:hypothetical protein
VHGHRFSEESFARAFAGAGFGRRGQGGRGRGPEAPPVERTEVAGWLAGRLPDDWFTGPPEITIDRDEITVIGTLPEPEPVEGDRAAACAGRIDRFREETRQERMAIADAAQQRYGLSVPVMTRLRQPERRVLDTLVDAGVARSRSEALAWAVRLVAKHADDWLAELRAAMESVEEVRGRGPSVD